MNRHLTTPSQIILLLALCTSVAGANSSHRAARTAQVDTTIQRIIALVDSQEVRSTIAAMEAFGTRRYNQDNRNDVFHWVYNRFASTGVGLIEADSFSYNALPQINVIATIPGTVQPDRVIVVGGHFDSANRGNNLEAPGADDNASGTAATVEMARVLLASGYQPALTWKFIGFGAEEEGLRGSAHYVGEVASAGMVIEVMHNFDMIGHLDHSQGDRDVNIVRYTGAENYADKVEEAALTYTTLNPLTATQYYNATDSYSFFLHGYPAVFLQEKDFNPWYHTSGDVLDVLDMAYAKEVIQASLASLLERDMAFHTTDVFDEAPVPSRVRLDQNFPNPFNPATRVAYELPGMMPVRLSVVDILGREVAVLVEGTRGPGRHEMHWDAGALPGGVYFLHLRTPEGGSSVKLLLLR